MAQVNIDDEWFVTDRRRSKLVKAVGGNEFIADGMAIAAWRLAQPYWKRGRKPVPLDKWDADLDPLITVGLARKQDDGVYVCGSHRHDWLVSRVEAGSKGGVESGKTRVEAKRSKRKQREPNPSKTKQNEANASNANPTTTAIPTSTAKTTTAPTTDRQDNARARDPDPPDPAAPAVGRSSVEEHVDPPLTPAGLIALWNAEKGTSQPETTSLSVNQKHAARLALAAWPAEAYWRAVIKRAADSDFANGLVPTEKCPGGWIATLPWLIENHDDVAHGKLDQRGRAKPRRRDPKCNWCGDTGRVAAVKDTDAWEFSCHQCEAGVRDRGQRWGAELVAAGWRLEHEPENSQPGEIGA